MSQEGVAYAGTVFSVNTGTAVAKLRSIAWNNAITKEDVSGPEDSEGEAPNLITRSKAIPVTREVTAEVSGIYLADNAGQGSFADDAEAGASFDFEWKDQRGYGRSGNGFFESFNITGELGGVWQYTGTIHVNTDSVIEGSS